MFIKRTLTAMLTITMVFALAVSAFANENVTLVPFAHQGNVPVGASDSQIAALPFPTPSGLNSSNISDANQGGGNASGVYLVYADGMEVWAWIQRFQGNVNTLWIQVDNGEPMGFVHGNNNNITIDGINIVVNPTGNIRINTATSGVLVPGNDEDEEPYIKSYEITEVGFSSVIDQLQGNRNRISLFVEEVRVVTLSNGEVEIITQTFSHIGYYQNNFFNTPRTFAVGSYNVQFQPIGNTDVRVFNTPELETSLGDRYVVCPVNGKVYLTVSDDAVNNGITSMTWTHHNGRTGNSGWNR